MKRIVFLFVCLTFVVAGVAAAEANSDARWIGVWQGKLEGLPGVTLTLGDDTGELGGTIVFNAVDSKHDRIVASAAHVLLHTQVDGNRLSFQVKRAIDSRDLNITVELTGDGKAQLTCLNCGSGSPVTELVKAQ